MSRALAENQKPDAVLRRLQADPQILKGVKYLDMDSARLARVLSQTPRAWFIAMSETHSDMQKRFAKLAKDLDKFAKQIAKDPDIGSKADLRLFDRDPSRFTPTAPVNIPPMFLQIGHIFIDFANIGTLPQLLTTLATNLTVSATHGSDGWLFDRRESVQTFVIRMVLNVVKPQWPKRTGYVKAAARIASAILDVTVSEGQVTKINRKLDRTGER